MTLPKEIVDEDVGRKDPLLGDAKEKTGKMWVCGNRPVSSSYRLSFSTRALDLVTSGLIMSIILKPPDKL